MPLQFAVPVGQGPGGLGGMQKQPGPVPTLVVALLELPLAPPTPLPPPAPLELDVALLEVPLAPPTPLPPPAPLELDVALPPEPPATAADDSSPPQLGAPPAIKATVMPIV